MYNIIKTVIETGKFELTDIIRKIDTVWFEGKITDEEKAELVEMAQGKANPQHSLDLIKKVADLEKRVKTLESKNVTSDTEDEEVTEETYEPFVEGKWYYNGDKCSEDGKNYTCTAPDGTPCVWSPSAYPPYWKLDE
mgnify:CR=1 FL=1